MKKILSVILAAAMLLGMLSVCAVAEGSEKPANTMLKFDDLPKGDILTERAISNLSHISKLTLNDGDELRVSMDFIYGRSGPCHHPAKKDLKHSSKFLISLGQSEGTFKFVGYSADRGTFFIATGLYDCYNGDYGEGPDGMEYLAESEAGLVLPGVKYGLEFVFTYNEDGGLLSGCAIVLDGETVVEFDLYDDLDYPTNFPLESLFIYPTHITCFIDNVVVTKDGETLISTDFESASMDENTYTDEITGETVSKGTTVIVDGWGFESDCYTLADPDADVYTQPRYAAAEGQTNIIFKSGLNKRANGVEEMFASSNDFKIPVTIKNNTGVNKIEMDLAQDPYITPKSVEAAEGLSATLEGTKLTITGDNYTGEELVTITYSMSSEATQGHNYAYGAYVKSLTVEGDVTNVLLTNGESKLYNYTVGDLNDDGKFNVTDVTYMLKLIAKWNLPGMFKEAGEVNGDGRFNNMDVTYYLKWIAKWPNDYTINGITWYKK